MSAALALGPQDALRLRVFVDGADAGSLFVRGSVTDGAPVDVVLANGLEPSAPHVVRLVNAVEPMHIYGGSADAARVPPAVLSFSTDGAFVAPPPQPSRTLMVIGDSISAGSGDVGVPPCHGDINTSDVTRAFGFLLAQSFGAQLLAASLDRGNRVRRDGDGNCRVQLELAENVLDGGRGHFLALSVERRAGNALGGDHGEFGSFRAKLFRDGRKLGGDRRQRHDNAIDGGKGLCFCRLLRTRLALGARLRGQLGGFVAREILAVRPGHHLTVGAEFGGEKEGGGLGHQ